MSDKVVYTSSGVSLSTLLGVTFIVLKLCNVIDWSWIWVLAPFWIPVSIAIAFFVLIAMITGFIAIVSLCQKK